MTRPESARRLEAFDRALEDIGVDGGLVTRAAGVRYLCGFTGSAGSLHHAAGGATTLITDFRYEEQAASEVAPGVQVQIASEGWIGGLADIIGAESRARIAFAPAHLSVLDMTRLKERLPDVEFVPERGLGVGQRTVKSAAEVDAIQRAAAIAETALAGLLESVEWSASPLEIEVAGRLEGALRAAGSEGFPFDVIVAAGERTSLPHATPSHRAVREGDLLLIDFGAIADGYCSDITRTFVVGSPVDWQVETHARVLEAQTAAIAALGPGVRAVDVDAAARELLASHGLDRYFGHSTGHGIGLEVHEGPRLSSRSEEILEPGNVVTVEPGVYLPGRGGVRIEDDVAVTETGSRVLTSASRDLIQL